MLLNVTNRRLEDLSIVRAAAEQIEEESHEVIVSRVGKGNRRSRQKPRQPSRELNLGGSLRVFLGRH